MVKSFLRCKKGVAEVVGSLVIILIVTIAGVGVYAYSLNAISSSSDNLNQKTNQYSEQALERFEILRVWSNGQDRLNITILNYGQTDLTINSVYVNGTAVQEYISGKDTTIGLDEIVTVEFTSPLTVQSSSCLQILAVSERGGKTTVFYET